MSHIIIIMNLGYVWHADGMDSHMALLSMVVMGNL